MFFTFSSVNDGADQRIPAINHWPGPADHKITNHSTQRGVAQMLITYQTHDPAHGSHPAAVDVCGAVQKWFRLWQITVLNAAILWINTNLHSH